MSARRIQQWSSSPIPHQNSSSLFVEFKGKKRSSAKVIVRIVVPATLVALLLAAAGMSFLLTAKKPGKKPDVATDIEDDETAPAPAPGEPMDLMTGLQLVVKKALAHGGLACGLKGCTKVIEKHAAQLCVLAEDCDQPDYVNLIMALCADHNVNLLTVPSSKTLGEWAGLCKIDSEGNVRRVMGCSCVVVKGFWRGNVPALLMVVPYTSIQFTILHKFKTYVSGSSKADIL